MKKLLISILLAFPMLMAAQIYTYPLVDSLPNDAHVYQLPKTGLTLCFNVRCIHESPGELARYAERFLGYGRVITEHSFTHEIVSVEVEPYTIADPERTFYMLAEKLAAKKGMGKKEIPTPELNTICNKDGILLAVNAVPATIESEKKAGLQLSQTFVKPSKQNEIGASQSYLTQEMKLANSSLKMAELAARQIFSIRETRLALLHGELENYPLDGEGFKLFLQELNDMEKQYLELFVGSHKEIVYQCKVQFVPEKGNHHDIVCRFSSQDGIIDKDDLSGRPIYCFIENSQRNIIQTPDSLSFQGKKKNETFKKEEPAGLYYYQPEMANISIKDGSQTLWRQDMVLAQMGQLLRLKTYDGLSIVLNPETGAIINR
ncbi:MAG: DUF4831 family protein [Bacteroidales bacterium]|nr:DUF4831 family protein [Bacteroidales bacterium]